MIVVDGKPHPWRVELTLEELMARVDPEGAIVVVRLNDRLVSRPNYPTTQIPDGADIHLIPMVAGG